MRLGASSAGRARETNDAGFCLAARKAAAALREVLESLPICTLAPRAEGGREGPTEAGRPSA
eukprot:12485336-Alexandrium_andersonii.AAC.1